MLSRAEEVDAEKDSRYGQDRRGDELPQELAFREGRLEKIREAMSSLRSRRRQRRRGKSIRVCRGTGRNATSPMPSRGSCPAPGGRDFVQAYNCQAVVDSANQVIVVARATKVTSDKQQAGP